MKAGLSEITLVFTAPDRLGIAKERLLAAADFAIRVAGFQKGQVINIGLSQGMYVPMTQAQKEYEDLLQLPKKLKTTMTLVDPNAATRDLEALKKFMRKLTVMLKLYILWIWPFTMSIKVI